MSARYNALVQFPDDPRQVELVKGLLEKTQQGKIGWVKQGTAVTTSLPNGIAVNFVLATALLSDSWQLFTVRDKQGNELVRVDSPGVFAIIAGSAITSPLLAATNELFTAVHGPKIDDLDRAIESVKKL